MFVVENMPQRFDLRGREETEIIVRVALHRDGIEHSDSKSSYGGDHPQGDEHDGPRPVRDKARDGARWELVGSTLRHPRFILSISGTLFVKRLGAVLAGGRAERFGRSEEHTSELQSRMRTSYGV